MQETARQCLTGETKMTAKILSTPHTKWVVVKITHNASKITPGEVYTVTMVNELGEIAHTYVDDSNRNQRHWMEIVALYNEGLSTIVSGLRFKKDKVHAKTREPLVNADSKPIAHGTMETHEAVAALTEILSMPVDRLFDYV